MSATGCNIIFSILLVATAVLEPAFFEGVTSIFFHTALSFLMPLQII